MIRIKSVFWAAMYLSILIMASVGCRSRAQYVNEADCDAYGLIRQKTNATPWAIPAAFSLRPSVDSANYQPGCMVCPQLPAPAPALYAYQLPYLRSNSTHKDGINSERQIQNTEPGEDALNQLGLPIPSTAWNAIPGPCLERMLDFESVRQEAKYTVEDSGEKPQPTTSDGAEKLTLNDIIDLALVNSRDYQTQKETLYQVSLQLSLQRFDYQTKFSASGNGTSLDYAHDRSGGITVNRLSIPTDVAIEKMLVTGGDILASFANNILLTFNGPTGFATDISSDILIRFAQPLLQKDVKFESLTQAERNLVYAARDFARFRKQFFVDFASQYYDLIRSFRQIEIDSQNYFSLVRAFNQAEAEYQAGLVPRFQVDQVEQNLLSGRARLIGTCNGVEQSLDRLKTEMGIPTETPINLDLTELNELTRLDQLSVSADSIRRVLTRLENALENPDRTELVSTAAVLIDRIIEAAELNQQSAELSDQVSQFKRSRARLLVDYSRLTAQQILADLQSEIDSDSPSLPVIFQRSQAHSEALLNLIERQIDAARLTEQIDASSKEAINRFDERRLEGVEAAKNLRDELQKMIEEERLKGLQGLVDSSQALRETLRELVDDVDRFNKIKVEPNLAADLARIIGEVEELLEKTSTTIDASGFGLKPIDIDIDDAMITALVLRYDLMNERGGLADDWRQIKLAADELKAIVNLDASQRISTSGNQPFNFSFDDSSTALRLTVDAPLNRRAERNSFRNTLIGYQRAYRNLTQLQDSIKFSVRNDLRNLALDREQYLIAVASAALAYERVVSTSLEFRLGTGGVSARDFLEAQQAYIDSLSSVASQHIDYIVDRAQLFLDLELLTVDESGFWTELKVEEYQPQPYFDIPLWGEPVYGSLPPVRYSKEILQMLAIPAGESEIHRQDNDVVDPESSSK